MRVRRPLKIAGWTLVGLLAAAVTLVGVAWAAANTQAGRAWIADALARQLGTAEAPAEVSGLHGALPHDMRLQRLVLRDADGTWLTIESARLSWRPLALLAGRLEITAAGAERVTLARLPAAAGDPDPEPAGPDELSIGIPELPLAVRARELQVGRFELGAALAGTAATLRIDGQAAGEARSLRSSLQIQRIDGAPGRLAAEAVFDRAARTLELKLELDAPENGLVASLLELPDAGASTVRLSGSGPVDAWQGRLDARLGAHAGIGADLRLHGARRLEAQGTARVAALLGADTRPLLGGPVEFDLAAERVGAGGVRIARGALRTPTAQATLSGGLSGDGKRVDARAEIRVQDPAPLQALAAPAEFDALQATLSAQGPPAAPELRLQAAADRLSVPEATLHQLAVTADYTPARGLAVGDLAARVESARIEPAIPDLAGYGGHPVSLSLDGRLDLGTMRLARARAQLSARGLELALDGGADLAEGAGDAAFDLQLAELARLDPALGLGLSGRGAVSGHARFGGDGPLVQATLAGELREVAADEAILQAVLGDRLDLATDLTVARDGALSLDALTLKSPHARAAGAIALPADFARIDGDLRAAMPDAAVLSPALGLALAGSAQAELRLSGPADDPGVAGTLTLDEAAVAGQALGRLRIEADTRTLASGAQGRIDASAAQSPLGALSAATSFALGGDALTLSRLQADAEGLRASADRLSVPLDGGALDGSVRLLADDLGGPLRRLADLQAAGSGELRLDLGPGETGQGVRLHGSFSGLALADGAATLRSLAVDAELDRAFANPAGTLRLDLAAAEAGPARFDSLTATARGELQALAVSLRGKGELAGAMSLAADAELDLAGAGPEMRLSRFDLEIGERGVRLARPAVLRRDAETLELRDLVLQVGDGRLALDGRRGPERVELTLDAADLPLGYSGLVLKSPELDGRLDARLRLQGPVAAPSGSLSLALQQVAAAKVDLPPADARLDATLSPDGLDASGQVTGLTETPIQLAAALPVELSLAPVAASLRPAAPVRGELAWSGAVAPLMPLVPASGHRLVGRGDVAFELGGTAGDPRVTGRMTLTDGLYENFQTGTLLTGLAVTVEGTGERVQITRFRANDGRGGSVSVSGGVDIAPAAGFPVDVAVDAANARLLRLDYLTADADLDLELTGTLQDLLLAGTVTVRGAEARMPQNLPPEVADLNVVTEAELQARRAAEAAGEAPAGPREEPGRIGLDVAVNMPGQVFVRGNGLDSEWAGNLVVTGTAAQPVVQGQLQVVRGRLNFLGQAFDLREGLVAFDGGRKVDPRVDVTAVNSTPDLTVQAEVTGSASNPNIELTSTPPLPQDEVLARLLFGKSAADLSPLEGAQLAAAVAQLSIGGGGPGLLDRLRGMIGVDVLRVGGGSGEGDTVDPTVEAGKYVTDEVFVGVEQGAGAESSKVKVEVDLTDNIVLESDVGATGAGNVGIQFRWDY